MSFLILYLFSSRACYSNSAGISSSFQGVERGGPKIYYELTFKLFKTVFTNNLRAFMREIYFQTALNWHYYYYWAYLFLFLNFDFYKTAG
jgi:hypothetical protein